MHMNRKPKLGQNFLVDDAARHAIADALGDVSQRTVIEIGPGKGAITEILAGRCKKLIALELDRALAPELTFRFRNQPQVRIIEADVLKTDLRALVPEGETADVIGNLPYYITSDILLRLFSAGSAGIVSRAVVMMQREVADRVSAAPGVRDYGLLSATAQMNAQVDHLFTLPPSAFSPPPEGVSRKSGRPCRTTFAQQVILPSNLLRRGQLVFRPRFARKLSRWNLWRSFIEPY
jgi:16S rRNA (adenine1518-N6/adenine1519-N6)-dimethyltransferase